MPIGWAIVIVVLWVAMLGLAVVVLGVLRQVTPILQQASRRNGPVDPGHQGPPVGERVPPFATRDNDGKLLDDQGLRGRPTMLLFLSSHCGPCGRLASEIRQAELGELARQLVIVTDAAGPQELGLPVGLRVVTEHSNEVSGALSVTGWPFVIAVDPDGIVRSTRVPNTLEHLEAVALPSSESHPADIGGTGRSLAIFAKHAVNR